MLIVEVFLGAVLIGSNLDPEDKLIGMWAGVAMFLIVVGIVAMLVWFKPFHLTFDKTAHLIDRGKIIYGTPRKTRRSKPDASPKPTPENEP